MKKSNSTKIKILFWIFWFLLMLVVWTYASPYLINDLHITDYSGISSTLFSEVESLSILLHRIELMLHIFIIGLMFDLFFSSFNKYQKMKEINIEKQLAFNKALWIMMLFLAIYQIYRLIQNFFIGKLINMYDGQMYSFANYGEFFAQRWIYIIFLLPVVLSYSNFISKIGNLLDLSKKNVLIYLPVIGFCLQMFAFTLQWDQIANTFVIAGALVIITLFGVLIKKTTGDVRKKSIYMLIGYLLLIIGNFWDVNTNLALFLSDGILLIVNWPLVFWEIYQSILYLIAGYIFLKLGFK